MDQSKSKSSSTSISSQSLQGSGGSTTPSPPQKNSVFFVVPPGGAVWVSDGLSVWSISDLGGGGGMQYNRLVFQAQRCIHSLHLDGYCRL